MRDGLEKRHGCIRLGVVRDRLSSLSVRLGLRYAGITISWKGDALWLILGKNLAQGRSMVGNVGNAYWVYLVYVLVLISICSPLGVYGGPIEEGLGKAIGLVEAGRFSDAEGLYRQLLAQAQLPQQRLECLKGLASVNAHLGKDGDVKEICKVLLASDSGKEQLAGTLAYIAEQCRNANRHKTAVEVYRLVLDRWPDAADAIWWESGLIASQLCQGNHKEADKAFEGFMARYKDSGNLGKAISQIADNLRWRDIENDRARQLYQVVVDGPDYADKIWARMGLAICDIRAKAYSQAGSAIDGLLRDYSQDSRIGHAICQIADAYRQVRRHKEAIGLYKYVLERYPTDPYALWSQMGIAVSAIDLDDKQAASEAIDGLGRYRSHPDYPHALSIVADNYRWRGRYQEALGLYKAAIEADGSHRYGIWFVMGLGISSVMVGDVDVADGAVGVLVNRYAGHHDLAQCLYEVGYAYSNAGLHQKAEQILQQVAGRWPTSRYGILARGALGLVKLRQQDQKGSQQVYTQLVEEHPGEDAVAEAIWLLGHEYYDQAILKEKAGLQEDAKGLFSKAIEAWGIIRDRYPGSSYAADAWYFSGVLYRRHLGDYGKALEYYQKVADSWPQYRYSWSAVGMLPTCYEKLKEAGLISQDQ